MSEKDDDSVDPEKKEEKDLDQKKLDALRDLGFDIPEDAVNISNEGTVAFGITPDGVQGGQQLASIIGKVFMDARMAGAPPEAIRQLAASLLGGLSISIAFALAGEGEADEENPLSKFLAAKQQKQSERAEIAATLCEDTTSILRLWGVATEEHENNANEDEDAPDLVSKEAAAELAKLFDAPPAEEKEEN